MHEILTIQLGQRANYLATHFWNVQESYFTFPPSPPSLVDHDIHFRPGLGADGQETYLPRTLIYDLKGGFGSLRKINQLYEAADDHGVGGAQRGVWDGNTVVQKQDPIALSSYQQSLDTGLTPPTLTTHTVRYWSDFNRLYFHPRSIVQLNDYALNSSLMPFEKWEFGEDLFSSLDKEHDLLDRDFRPWAEECDQMQGIQIFTGVDDAWGGFAARYVERLRDEYGKGTIWVWGIEENERGPKHKQTLRLTNSVRSMHDIPAHASMYIPVQSLPLHLPRYVALDRTSQWHTSALISGAIESTSLQSRLKPEGNGRAKLDEIETILNSNGNQRVAGLQCSFLDPQVSNTHSQVANKKGRNDNRMRHAHGETSLRQEVTGEMNVECETFDIDFFPGDGQATLAYPGKLAQKSHIFGQVESFRGQSQQNYEEAKETEDDSVARKRMKLAGLPASKRYHYTLPFPLLDSFPKIFEEWSNLKDSVIVCSSLSTSTKVARRIRGLQKLAGRVIGIEEQEALSNGLGELAEEYEEGWSSGSDADSDD